jgi:serine/threonine-protein kinase RIO1
MVQTTKIDKSKPISSILDRLNHRRPKAANLRNKRGSGNLSRSLLRSLLLTGLTTTTSKQKESKHPIRTTVLQSCIKLIRDLRNSFCSKTERKNNLCCISNGKENHSRVIKGSKQSNKDIGVLCSFSLTMSKSKSIRQWIIESSRFRNRCRRDSFLIHTFH